MLRHRRAFTAGHSAQLIAAESHCRWRSKRDPEGVHRGLCLLLAPLVSPPEPSTWCDLHRPALQAMNTRQTARLSCHDDVLGDQTQTTRRHPMLCAQAPTSEVSLDVDSPCKTTPEVRTILRVAEFMKGVQCSVPCECAAETTLTDHSMLRHSSVTGSAECCATQSRSGAFCRHAQRPRLHITPGRPLRTPARQTIAPSKRPLACGTA